MENTYFPFHCTHLAHRSVLIVRGRERKNFLQGLISNDTTKLDEKRGLYSLFLTPQGRIVHDLFLIEQNEAIFLDIEKEHLEAFLKKLGMYRLRADVSFEVAPNFQIFYVYGSEALARLNLKQTASGTVVSYGTGWAMHDPRLTEAGVRVITPSLVSPLKENGSFEDYDRFRLSLGLPEGSCDLPVEKAIPLENGMDELHAIDWKKGCYLGQELTARTKYRALIQRRLLPVKIEGTTPEPLLPVYFEGKESGTMHSSQGNQGLAMIKLESFEIFQETGQPFTCGEAQLFPFVPDWMRLPDKT